MEIIERALEFMEEQNGNDIEIESYDLQGKDVRVVWRETGDTDKYFSVVGENKLGKLIVKIEGEY